MFGVVSAWCILIVIDAGLVETKFVQVYPEPAGGAVSKRSPGQARAVVLVHGLRPHLFSNTSVARAGFQDWQLPGSTLVKTLGKDSDVFAFAYGQNVAVDHIADVPALAASIRQLRDLGYSEVVLVGHSAGGLVARQFVEDFPGLGVSKVIQVCPPNGGSSWSKVKLAVRWRQELFLDSLSKEARQLCLKERTGKKIPDGVQFICLVGNGAGPGDGVVSCRCQWTEDLQKQGIPADLLGLTHFRAMRSAEGAAKIAELIRDKQPRWDALKVNLAKPKILGGHEHLSETPEVESGSSSPGHRRLRLWD